ncbi:MAG: methyltransferase domain-containing protein, partial [Bacteroidales bacterium]|nr:methyltransferase domain-containing protein [Bacteroidales bacterium]
MNSKDLKLIVKGKYGNIVQPAGNNAKQAGIPVKSSCCGDSSGCCGSGFTMASDDYSTLEGYDPDADYGLGCGIPTRYAGIRKGNDILDLGSGAGNDCFVARAIVGENGSVTGLDMTPEMVA